MVALHLQQYFQLRYLEKKIRKKSRIIATSSLLSSIALSSNGLSASRLAISIKWRSKVAGKRDGSWLWVWFHTDSLVHTPEAVLKTQEVWKRTSDLLGINGPQRSALSWRSFWSIPRLSYVSKREGCWGQQTFPLPAKWYVECEKKQKTALYSIVSWKNLLKIWY